MTAPVYAFRVLGHLDRHWAERLGDLSVAHHPDGTTTLTGPVTDQARLLGVVNGLRDLGATLVELHPVRPGVDDPHPG